ncbi:hypothetical protein SAMN04487962_1336 [Marinobacter segnicrescens]|uniref:Uncharacterized protein n=1 Tax=Marinobacter segnicrescens TaxID=430453 RepID=A0A1I0HQZ5_9GAMM|nr:hypothetical protein [Marinobacter segnicrescens]SET86436.1 hypothetical protein SAMN04487962_1336 [Marinobacter segnicrescens]
MTQKFEDFITEKNVSGHDLAQAARYYLSERCDDPTTTEMREALYTATENPTAVDAGLDLLARDPVALDQASYALLAWAWDQPDEVSRVESAIGAAKQKLPVIEAGLLAMVAMYGMYLVVTGNRKRTTTTVYHADGTKTEKVEEYYPPSLSGLTAIFKMRRDDDS